MASSMEKKELKTQKSKVKAKRLKVGGEEKYFLFYGCIRSNYCLKYI
jgi:hypothetical protein